MNSDIIKYTTPEEQIEKLKSQNLLIPNETLAKQMLSEFGYSNLIKSYREPYMYIDKGNKVYRSNITIEQIYSLYKLDKNLRNAVMAAMLDLEEHIKEAAADVIAQSFGTHPENYLKFRNYQNKTKRKYRFTLKGVLETMRKTLDTDKNPIYHYQKEHGIVPPWILFKSIYFTTINNFIDQFKAPEQEKLVHKLYDLDAINLPMDSARKLMMDTLFICQEYRNIAAHGGRTYNYVCDKELRKDKIFPGGIELRVSGFSELLFLLNLLKHQSPFKHLHHVLDRELNRHCQNFPQDITYLGQILNIDIVPHNIVYITKSSNKYHTDAHCSGIQHAQQIDLEDAKKEGYIPCKRCATNITPIF